MNPNKSGSCLCGGVRFLTRGPLRDVVNCHCNQCRKSSGHYVAATQSAIADIEITGDSLTWYASSENAERGFCSTCGSSLFWRPVGGENISIMAGTIDSDSELSTTSQLYSEAKGDYYTLPNVPVVDQSTLER